MYESIERVAKRIKSVRTRQAFRKTMNILVSADGMRNKVKGPRTRANANPKKERSSA